MRRSLLLLVVGASAACGRASPLPPPLTPQTTGTIAIAGLQAPVRVVFDQRGVPHIYAVNTPDLFVAQGFVQAQDRLFQIDLWRRASQGRLAEILGANFIDRDAMTRRIQYHGDPDLEWASYGRDARTIAEAFVRGINAYVSLARERLPEEFRAAGWPPSYWFAGDLLNRTDAFVTSSGALDEISRAGLPDVVGDAVRLVGTPPFLIGSGPPDSETRARSGSRLVVPSPRYLVHLVAPGWNVIGATAPWRPGVVEGHTDRVAWTLTAIDVPTERVDVVRTDRTAFARSADFLRVIGRPTLVAVTREAAGPAIVIATDHQQNRAFGIRWLGFEPGGAAELGALALDRAQTTAEFRDALARWKLPATRFTFRDVDGGSGSQEVPGGPPGSVRRPAARSAAQRDTANVTPSVIFAHVLGVANRLRLNVGPVSRPSDDRQTRIAPDMDAWDRSRAINAPGQSGSPASDHYRDAAGAWSGNDMFELWFSEAAVRAHDAGTLMLIPRQ